MNKSPLSLPPKKRLMTLKRFTLLLLIVSMTLTVFTPSFFTSADDSNKSIVDWLVDAITDLFTPDPVPCDDESCTVTETHNKGEIFECKHNFYGWSAVKKDWAYGVAHTFSNTDGLTTDLAFKIDDNKSLIGGVWHLVTYGYEAMQTIGFLIVILYFILEILDLTTKENFNLEQLLRMTIKLFIAILLITNGLDILKALINLSDGLISTLTWQQGSGLTAKNLYYQVQPLSDFDAIFFPLTHLFDCIGLGLPAIIICFIVHGRVIEVCVRAVFAPLAIANIYEGGLNSSGMKYLKKFLALCLHGVFILACIIFKQELQRHAGVLAAPLAVLIIELCGIAAIIKSKKWAENLLGV